MTDSSSRKTDTVDKYFAYGSNCDPAVMEKKGVPFTARRRAVLRGYRLRFNKRAHRERLPDTIGFANINEWPGGAVEGILYDLAREHLPALDRSERCPGHYQRIRVAVETELGPEDCWAYKATPSMLAEGLVPSRNYVDHILAGREFLSQQYLDALNQSKTYRGECVSCRRELEVIFVKEGDRLRTLCQPCREARLTWSDAVGRTLTVAETEAVMTELVVGGAGFASIADLIKEAIRRGLIER